MSTAYWSLRALVCDKLLVARNSWILDAVVYLGSLRRARVGRCPAVKSDDRHVTSKQINNYRYRLWTLSCHNPLPTPPPPTPPFPQLSSSLQPTNNSITTFSFTARPTTTLSLYLPFPASNLTVQTARPFYHSSRNGDVTAPVSGLALRVCAC